MLLFGTALIATVQAQAPTTAPNEEWLTYTHPEWGITFQYPPDWEVSVPDFENIEQTPEDWRGLAPYEPNPEYLRTLGHHISLYPPAVNGFEAAEIAITLDVHTLSPNGTLEELVNLRGELEDTTAPELESVREKVEVVDQAQPADVDDVLYTSIKSFMHEAYITWMARGPLVYFVASFSSDPAVTSIGREIAASLRFNADKEQVILEKALFSGDETTIANTIERLRSVHEEIGDEPGRQDTGEVANPDHEQATVAAVPANVPKPLPSTWISPGPSGKPVNCGSPKHTGGASFAIDPEYNSGTSINFSQSGTVVESMLATNGYGETIVVETTVNPIRGGTRYYRHRYAHLLSRNTPYANNGNYVYWGGYVGQSGATTGNSDVIGAHLHFHVNDSGGVPVDLTPILGFRPDENYPEEFAYCGWMVTPANDEVVIEAAAYQAYVNQLRWNDANTHQNYWQCYTWNAGECYMKAEPNAGNGFNSPVNNSPEFQYSANMPATGTWYVWVCGDSGGSGGDDTIHFGMGGTPLWYAMVAAATVTGTPPNQLHNWHWQSSHYDPNNCCPRPTVNVTSVGVKTFNVWIREDGTRFSRILLTRSSSYNPEGNIHCGVFMP